MTAHRMTATCLAGALLLALAPAGARGGQESAGIDRIAGATRLETAVAVSRRLFPSGEAPAAVLARADGFADGLAGVPLAHHLGAPLLLTGPDDLPEVTRAELGRVLAADAVVHVLGGERAVSARVAAQVEELGHTLVRHGGEDRYGTAAAVASALPEASTAVLAAGDRFADALPAGPVAAAAGWPLLLTTPTGLPQATRDALRERQRVVIVGGPEAVSEGVAGELAERGLEVERVAGTTRAGTAVALADHFTGSGRALVASSADFPDALTGGVLAAGQDAPVVYTLRDGLPGETALWLARRRPAVALLGGTAVASDLVPEAVAAALRSDPDAVQVAATDPPVGATVERLHRVAVTTRPAAQSATFRITVAGIAASGTTRLHDGTWEFEADPLPPLPPGRHALRVETELAGPGGTRHTVHGATLEVHTPTRRSSEGWVVAPGTSPVAGSGPLTTFSVEVEPATGIDANGVAAAVEDALLDRRSWTAGGVALQRVDDPAAARVRVVVATPGTVDRWCAPVADTAGRYSCWEGRRAMLNSGRWQAGADPFGGDLVTYRRHLVNHEVGHALGHGHTGCPAPGVPAPIMMQQTKSTAGCVPNGWPYP